MSSDDEEDDEALTWAGGRDPSHYETPEAKTPKAPRPPRRAKSSESEDAPDEIEEGLPPVTSSAVLISLGILAGIYLLYTIGWVVSSQRFVYNANTGLDEIAFQAQQYLAIIAPPLWFATTLLFTRRRREVVRLLWLLLGVALLVPWSFVLGS